MKKAFIVFLIFTLVLSASCASILVDHVVENNGTVSPPNLFSRPKPSIDSSFLPKANPGDVDSSTTTCPAVSLSVRQIAQETNSWCWATSAQTVMDAHGFEIDQCAIVNEVKMNGSMVDDVPFCCLHDGTGREGECKDYERWPDQAFDRFGFNWDWYPDLLSREEVAGQLCEVGPFIYVVFYEGGGGHSLVVESIEYDSITGDVFLWVYDHYWVNRDTYPSPAENVYQISYQDFLEGVWRNGRDIHAFDYVQLFPL